MTLQFWSENRVCYNILERRGLSVIVHWFLVRIPLRLVPTILRPKYNLLMTNPTFPCISDANRFLEFFQFLHFIPPVFWRKIQNLTIFTGPKKGSSFEASQQSAKSRIQHWSLPEWLFSLQKLPKSGVFQQNSVEKQWFKAKTQTEFGVEKEKAQQTLQPLNNLSFDLKRTL